MTSILALCTGLPVFQNYRTEISGLPFHESVPTLHVISEGVLTSLLALCTVLPVCQNYRAEIEGLPFHEPAGLRLHDFTSLRVH